MNKRLATFLSLLLAGCSGAPGPVQTPGQSPTGQVSPHPGPDLSRVTQVEGIVYQADANQLVLFTASSALRFSLTPNSQKRLQELRPGVKVQVQVAYPAGGHGMEVDSFKVLAQASFKHPDTSKFHVRVGNPHLRASGKEKSK